MTDNVHTDRQTDRPRYGNTCRNRRNRFQRRRQMIGVDGWLSDNGAAHINEVTLRLAQLALRWESFAEIPSLWLTNNHKAYSAWPSLHV